jgi:hypothetical protein
MCTSLLQSWRRIHHSVDDVGALCEWRAILGQLFGEQVCLVSLVRRANFTKRDGPARPYRSAPFPRQET